MNKKIFISLFLFVVMVLFQTKSSAFTIVLDPGHGASDSGAVNSRGVCERDVNMKIANYLQEYLSEYQDCNVYLTRDANSPYYDIFERAMIIRRINPDIAVSLHCNASSNGTGNGAEVLVTMNKSLPKYNQQEEALGNKILDNLSALGLKRRGFLYRQRTDSTDVYSDGTRADYYGIICYSMRGCKIDYGVISPAGAKPANIQNGEGVPAIIVEHCFMEGDANYVGSESMIKAMAEADGKAIVDYYNLKKKNYRPLLTSVPFNDCYADEWYCRAIEYVYNNKIMTGYENESFGPDDKLTRGMLVTMLYRLQGSPNVTIVDKFPDVKNPNEFYYKAVNWAASSGVVMGYENGNFGPEDNITREQLAVMLKRYAEFKGKDTSVRGVLNRFADYNRMCDFSVESMKWAVGVGIIKGDGNGRLNAWENATRAEVAAMIQRFCTTLGK